MITLFGGYIKDKKELPRYNGDAVSRLHTQPHIKGKEHRIAKIAQVVEREVLIPEYDRACGFTPRKVGAGEYTLEEHDSIRIDAEHNRFY